MKTPEQIRQWLEARPWYEQFKEIVLNGCDIFHNAKKNILNGKRGVFTILEAIGPDCDIENWPERDDEFRRWFCNNEDNNI